jgi:hypothetical protein
MKLQLKKLQCVLPKEIKGLYFVPNKSACVYNLCNYDASFLDKVFAKKLHGWQKELGSISVQF